MRGRQRRKGSDTALFVRNNGEELVSCFDPAHLRELLQADEAGGRPARRQACHAGTARPARLDLAAAASSRAAAASACDIFAGLLLLRLLLL